MSVIEGIKRVLGIERKRKQFKPVENASGHGAFWVDIQGKKLVRYQVPAINFDADGNGSAEEYFKQKFRESELPFAAARHGEQGVCQVEFKTDEIISITDHFLEYDPNQPQYAYILKSRNVDNKSETIWINTGYSEISDENGRYSPYIEIRYGNKKNPNIATIGMIHK